MMDFASFHLSKILRLQTPRQTNFGEYGKIIHPLIPLHLKVFGGDVIPTILPSRQLLQYQPSVEDEWRGHPEGIIDRP